MKIWEQGDVLLIQDSLPKKGLEKIKEPVIEYGEHTGHAHRLTEGEYEFYNHPKTKERYLRVVTPTTVRHEEHAPIILPPGDYRTGKVREKGMFDDLIAPVVD